MLVCTSWKTRALTPEQIGRMMSIWGKIEADQAENSQIERLCWYMFSNGQGGFTVSEVADDAEVHRFNAEIALSLGEFLELDSTPVVDIDTALPAITGAMERIKG